jgi:hypothetical protein
MPQVNDDVLKLAEEQRVEIVPPPLRIRSAEDARIAGTALPAAKARDGEEQRLNPSLVIATRTDLALDGEQRRLAAGAH